MSTIELPSRNLRLVETPFDTTARPWLLVHAVRTLFLICILLVSVSYQVHLGNFINIEIWFPVYAVLLFNFALNSVFLLFFDKLEKKIYWNAMLFAVDSIAVTLLIYFTGTSQSLFLFLYLVNLILGSLVFDKEGAWFLAIWNSICFSSLLILSPEISGQGLYFSLAVNNLAFFAVTYLGARLSDQVSVVGTRLQEVNSDLMALQNLNELIVNNITNGMVVVSRTDFVQLANPISVEILGGGSFAQLKIQDVLPELEWPWASIVDDESLPYERRELRLQREGAGRKVLEVVAARLKDADGKLKGWLFLIDDRTDQVLMQENMRQQEKLAAVGQLAAGVAHEIRNPLASISGSIQLMLGNPHQHSDEDMKLMRIVDKEINRLNNLISEFLEYARPEKKHSQRVDVNPVIRECCDAMQFNPKLRKDVEVTLKLNAACEILGNRDKLKQALLNFVINAFQAMEKTEHPKLEIDSFDSGEWVILTIKDNGCGIKPENVSRVFEPFHTTKPSGTGLGLAVTHKILEAHDARFGIASEVGVGTKFTLEFPAVRDHLTSDLFTLRKVSKG